MLKYLLVPFHPISEFLMSDLIRQKFVIISILTFIFISCNQKDHGDVLECLLDSIAFDLSGIEIEVGQHNGWTDTTALIIITYHKISSEIPIGSTAKGQYNGTNIYFYQTSIDSLDSKMYDTIPNSIDWHYNIPQKIDVDFITPPYDPNNIQVEYNFQKKCIVSVKDKIGLFKEDVFSNCSCK